MGEADPVTIALDCMGGDHGVAEPVKAAAFLSTERRDIETLLVGDGVQISRELDSRPYDPSRISVVHTEHWVRPSEPSRQALARPGRKSSQNEFPHTPTQVHFGLADKPGERGPRL